MHSLIFDPKKWHSCKEEDWRSCDRGVNCYSYVLDRPDYFWSVPGVGFFQMSAQKYIDAFNVHFSGGSREAFRLAMINGAQRDGLILVDEPLDREGYYPVALFFAEDDEDFHWYRKDDDGTWSHKDGWHAPSNQDELGQVIEDPRTHPPTAYTLFGGFFLVPQAGIRLEKRLKFS